ncbi:hypothetical protein AURDEDRAFT_183634 [Auricularia subglabra TFB-10046 SS5]|nr:hypothetical protein AURDEDRAFT_183634 [Auricularia subglabra TFB-10046 SS5]
MGFFTPSRLLGGAAAFVVLRRGASLVVAQSNYVIAPCNRRRSEVAWTFNEKGESPCFQWWNLGSACYGDWPLGTLTSNNTNYNEPPQQDVCECGVLAYNLMAACTWCEDENFNSNWIAEKQWSTNCDTFNKAGIDANTGDRVFSKWAFAPNFGAKWDPARSEKIAITGKVPEPARKLSKGAIAGVVISVLVIVACLCGIAFLLYRRRRARLEPHVTPDQFEAKLYDTPSLGGHQASHSTSKSLLDASSTAVTRAPSTADASSPAMAQAPAVVDADSIALAILRRVGHEPPGYTAPPASSTTSPSSTEAYPAYPVSSSGAPTSSDSSQFGVSSQRRSNLKRQSLPALPAKQG